MTHANPPWCMLLSQESSVKRVMSEVPWGWRPIFATRKPGGVVGELSGVPCHVGAEMKIWCCWIDSWNWCWIIPVLKGCCQKTRLLQLHPIIHKVAIKAMNWGPSCPIFVPELEHQVIIHSWIVSCPACHIMTVWKPRQNRWWRSSVIKLHWGSGHWYPCPGGMSCH